MAESFRCVVATPTRELFVGEVHYADVPGFMGHYGVLKGHENLVATNHQGGKVVLWLDEQGNDTRTFLIHRGCSQMMNNHLAILGRFGCEAEEIDPEAVSAKAERLSAEIEEHRAALSSLSEEEQRAEEAWITTEEIHLSWYEAQIDFAVNGKESYKQ